MNVKCCLFIIPGLFMIVSGFAQDLNKRNDKNQNFIISGAKGYGNVIPTNPFVKGDNLQGKPIENYRFFSVKALWQNPGYTDWQKVYSSPYYGFGVSIGDFFNSQEIGYPISSYGVLGIPLIRYRKIEAYSEFQFGFTSNWGHYDSTNNPKNIAIGGGLTVHLDVALKLLYSFNRKVDLGFGASFIHFSNGGFERPNRGFNIYSPFIELRYRLNARPDYKKVESAGKLKRSNSLYFMLGYGDHQLVENELDTNYFAVGGISAIYYNQVSNALRIGSGLDLNYWWGLNANPDGTIGPRKLENFTVGVILQPEFMIDKLVLVGGVGIYAIHRNYGNFKQTYQRLGVRYEVYKNISLGVNIRAINFFLAEFLEFNMGYRIKWMK